MKICRFLKNGSVNYGVVRDGKIDVTKGLPYDEIVVTGEQERVESVRLLAPAEPRSIVAVGLNYRRHAQELGAGLPEEPVIFSKFTSSVLEPFGEIVKPAACKRLDYEAELAVVIGRQCRGVAKEAAKEYIFGYTCLNDVTARDLQDMKGQWERCKGFDTFTPFGPWVETELEPGDLRIRAVLNGKTVQDDTTADLIFDVGTLVEYVSGFMTLYPGDLISTGTPGGIGPMERGDEIKVVIEGIGELVNRVR